MTFAHVSDLNAMAVAALPHWWERIDQDTKWQEYSFVALAVAYGLIALVALVQLVRIQQRVPEYGWTTQKVFHLLNAFVCILRCVVFALRRKVGVAKVELHFLKNWLPCHEGWAIRAAWNMEAKLTFLYEGKSMVCNVHLNLYAACKKIIPESWSHSSSLRLPIDSSCIWIWQISPSLDKPNEKAILAIMLSGACYLKMISLQVQSLDPPIMQEVLLDLPGLLFFSTYTLLVLFWAEIYHQARSLSTTALRPMFVAFNGVVYAVQVSFLIFTCLQMSNSKQSSSCFNRYIDILLPKNLGTLSSNGPPKIYILMQSQPCVTRTFFQERLSECLSQSLQIALWIFSGVTSGNEPSGISRVLSCCFLAIVSLVAAAGFMVYGGRLFLMLRR